MVWAFKRALSDSIHATVKRTWDYTYSNPHSVRSCVFTKFSSAYWMGPRAVTRPLLAMVSYMYSMSLWSAIAVFADQSMSKWLVIQNIQRDTVYMVDTNEEKEEALYSVLNVSSRLLGNGNRFEFGGWTGICVFFIASSLHQMHHWLHSVLWVGTNFERLLSFARTQPGPL